LANAAQMLTAGGVLLLGFGVFIFLGATLSLASAGPGPTSETVAHHAQFWSHMRFYLTDPGLMSWGLGQLLFGWLAWRSRALPRWLCIVGGLGGTAGLLTLAVYETDLLALLQLLAFATWGIGVGVKLLRAPSSPGTGT
jgi:hypothetical protein